MAFGIGLFLRIFIKSLSFDASIYIKSDTKERKVKKKVASLKTIA